MRAFERLPAAEGLQTVRVTYELLRPVPIAQLELRSEVVRGGKRVQLLEASLWTEEGIEVVRARALQTVAADAPESDGAETLAGPLSGEESDLVPRFRPMFAPDVMEIRFLEGQFTPPGPATGWFRMRVPVLPRRGALAAPAARGRRRLRQRDQHTAVLGHPCVHQP